jgi:phosphocarrier protein FPr
MSTVQVTVNHKVGLHARPASEFVKTAKSFPCEIKVRNMTADGEAVNAKSILGVLTLGVLQGHIIEIEAEGPQTEDALQALENLVLGNFGE